MITVYGYAPSSKVQEVMWGIGEFGLALRLVPLGQSHGGLDTPAFRG